VKPAYTGTAKSLHWLILALLIVQFVLAWMMPHIGRNTPLTTLIDLHFSFGVLILFVAAIRLIWRLTHSEPEPEAGVPPWQYQTAQMAHWLLYLLLFVVPILGWINGNWRLTSAANAGKLVCDRGCRPSGRFWCEAWRWLYVWARCLRYCPAIRAIDGRDHRVHRDCDSGGRNYLPRLGD